MKGIQGLWAYSCAALLASAAMASGQPPHHPHHHRMAAPGYDRSAETTVKCRLDAVEEVTPVECEGCEGGIHLRATCDGEPYDVHLGPASFIEGKDFPLAEGDEIEVTGARVPYEGGTSLVAREIRKGKAVLELRDEQGRPLWRRSR